MTANTAAFNPRRSETLGIGSTTRPASISLDLADQTATESLARRLAPLAHAGDVIALSGDLGAGKTVFARAFVRARGNPAEDVPSPTFTLVQVYPGNPGAADVYHFDLFRCEDPEEAIELGIDEAFAEAVSLIEWPDRLGPFLPSHSLDVTLAAGPSPESRHAVLTGGEEWLDRISEAGIG